MSYFDDASLVMIPSGYKTSKVYSVKPTDGTGDLTFTRSNDTATRVGPDGLIEKVRTNLLLQSNTFTNATWDKLGVSVTAGQAGYDGTNNATLITVTSAFPRLQQNITNTGLQTLSVYAKAATYNYLFINSLQNGTGDNASFDLVAGTQTISFSTQVSSSITSVGNGWWKIVIAFSNTTFGTIAFGTSVDGSVPAWVIASAGSVLIQNAQIETGDIATPYIATTTAAVSVGPVANVPRLDYLNSSCPRLLLEPQRTNLLTYSEQLNTGSGGTSVVTANTQVSPDGYTNADTIGTGYWTKLTSQTAGTYTLSVFAKYQSAASILLYIYDGAYYQGSFNLQTGVATTSTGSPSVSMVSYGNGWYRCIVTATTASTISEVGFGSGNFYGYGLQLEAGAYATSYIPTLGASVTRGADAASKTGISSLIGQTEGTLFVEAILTHSTPSNEYLMQVSANGDNRFFIYREASTNKLGCFARVGASTIFNNVTAAATTGTIKAAFAYKSGSFAFYVNGVQIAVSSATYTTPASMGIFDLDSNAGSENGFYTYAQTLLFTTRLTNSQLAELTTI